MKAANVELYYKAVTSHLKEQRKLLTDLLLSYRPCSCCPHYKTLRDPIDGFDHFNILDLSVRLAMHDLLEFRRVAAHLNENNQRWDDSINL